MKVFLPSQVEPGSVLASSEATAAPRRPSGGSVSMRVLPHLALPVLSEISKAPSMTGDMRVAQYRGQILVKKIWAEGTQQISATDSQERAGPDKRGLS